MAKGFFQRAGALFMAVLFLATSIAFTGFILLQDSQSKNPNQTNPQEEQAQTNKESTMQLQGTKLEGFTPIAAADQIADY